MRRHDGAKTTDMDNRRVRLTSTVTAGYARLMSAAAKAGVAAILAVGLFGWSPYVPPAQAADIQLQIGTNASLAFSPFVVGAYPEPQVNNLCARNLNSASVTVQFQIDVLDGNNQFFVQQSHLVQQIPPGGVSCFPPAVDLSAGHGVQAVASIVLQSPTQCSQATQYPGNCRVLGSLEISDNFSSNRIHMEPVLLPGLPGPPLPVIK